MRPRGPGPPRARLTDRHDHQPTELSTLPRTLWVALALIAPATASATASATAQQAQASDPARMTLERELSTLLSTRRWRGATWGALVVSLDTGDTLFAQQADSALVPASNMKLLTSAAALHRLGPEFRFRTYVVSSAPVVGETLQGDLVLYGTGDPGISARFFSRRTEVFEALADQLLARGITTVRGDLVGDASFLAGPLRSPDWDPLDLNDFFAAGVSALSYNENVVSVRAQPGRRAGDPPILGTIPAYFGLEWLNYGQTVEGRARRRLIIIRDHPDDPIRVQGHIQRAGRDVWRQLTVPDPGPFTLASFGAVLAERGITVLGRERIVERPSESVVTGARVIAPRRADVPRVRTLARHESPPLAAFVEVVNRESNNLFAELLFRTLGRVSEGAGTPAASARAVAASLAELSVDVEGLQQTDGSGLAKSNRVSPLTLVQTLERMSESPYWPQYWHSLPTMGRGGDLRRMSRTAAEGNLRAKTGTVDGVSALSGLVRSADGERLVFSLLLNGTPSEGAAKRTENLVGVRLASFSRTVGTPAITSVTGSDELASSEPARHRVLSGENLSVIAARYGVDVALLLRANPGVEPRRVLPGQWITIPTPVRTVPGA